MIRRRSYWPSLYLLLMSIIFAACQAEPEIPTLAPTVVAPTLAPPTSTPLPTIAPATSEPVPTETPTQTPTPSATPVIPRMEATPAAQSGVNITSPKEHMELIQGVEASVGGLSQLGTGESLSVSLVIATGQTIAVADTSVHQFNNWDGRLITPLTHSGSANVVAKVLDDGGNIIALDTQEIVIRVNPEITDSYLDLFRPISGDRMVAGFNMFFDGWAQKPVNSQVSISLWIEGCSVQVARQNFILRGSGYWQGFLIIPAGVSGPACAIAHFGGSGTEVYREAQIALDVLPANHEDAFGVVIGNPPADSNIAPGSTLLLYGTSYNALKDEIRLTIHSEDGRLITEGIAEADIYGYWELPLFIPSEAAGLAELAAVIGESGEDSYAEYRVMARIGLGE